MLLFYNNLSEFYWLTGEFQKGFETAEKGLELGRKIGALMSMAWIGSALGFYHVCMGEIQKAISMMEDFLILDKRAKFTAHIAYVMGTLGECYYWLGEWDKSLQYLIEARDIAKKTGEYQASATTTFSLGELFMEMKDHVEAEKYFNKSSNICEKAGETDFQLAMIFPALSKLHLKKGEIEKAKELVERTYEYVTKIRNRFDIAYADMLKAMIFREQKDWEQSIQYFEKSLQGYRSLNVQKWYVHRYAELLYEYGAMHLERNAKDDKRKGNSLLTQAREIYQKMDAKKMIEKTELKIAPLETGGRIVKPKPVAEESLPGPITTGYGDLDDLLHGGIPRNYAVLLTAPACDERDFLIRRFLEAGIKEGQTTFYVITKTSGIEYLAEEFPSNFYLYVCNPQASKIMKDSPNVFKLKGVDNLTDINIALNSAFHKLDATPKTTRRICIEITSDILLQHHTVQTRKWVNALIPELKSKGFTTLAVLDPEIHPPQEVRAIVGIFEGEINIHDKETTEGLKKLMKIKKMANQEYSDSELPLRREKLVSEKNE
jgi:tetratricopeptide (TPR) repeat protein/KaiC/GvpD/RAD55 family RecA-like ATPase